MLNMWETCNKKLANLPETTFNLTVFNKLKVQQEITTDERKGAINVVFRLCLPYK